MDGYSELRDISKVAREEVEKAAKTPETKKRGSGGVSRGQIAGLTCLVMAIPALCLWLVLPFISSKK